MAFLARALRLTFLVLVSLLGWRGALCCDLCDGIERADSAVVKLTDDTIDAALAAHTAVLLGFYAPWCEMCKWFAPTYEKVASTLRAEGVLVAKVSVAEHPRLARRFGVEVTNQPVLRVVRRGHVMPYSGAHVAAPLVSTMRAHARPAVVDLGDDGAAAERFSRATDGPLDRVVLRAAAAAGDSAHSALVDVADEVAGTLLLEAAFGSTRSGEYGGRGADERVVEMTRLWVATPEGKAAAHATGIDEQERVQYLGPASFGPLRDWTVWRGAPMCAELTAATVQRYLRRGSTAVLALDAHATPSEVREYARALCELARVRAPRADAGEVPVWLVWLRKADPVHGRLLRKLGLEGRGTDFVVLNVTGPGEFTQHTLRQRPSRAPALEAVAAAHLDSYARGELRADVFMLGIRLEGAVWSWSAALGLSACVAAIAISSWTLRRGRRSGVPPALGTAPPPEAKPSAAPDKAPASRAGAAAAAPDIGAAPASASWESASAH